MYSDRKVPDILSSLQRLDPMLGFRYHVPTESWHLIRYPKGRDKKFTIVWKLRNDPSKGLRRYPGLWMIEALQLADMRGNAMFRELEIDEHNRQLEKRKESLARDQRKDYAEAVRRPLQRLYNEGNRSNHREVF